MSTTEKFKVGDRIKYTYTPGKPGDGWFIADIAKIEDHGYIANLVDKGENTPYQSNTFNGISIGDDRSGNIELVKSPRLGGTVIGSAPVVTSPTFVAPFRADEYAVWDAKGQIVTGIDSEGSSSDDQVIGQVVAAALSEYFKEDK